MSERYVVRERSIHASECIGFVIEDTETGEEMARGIIRQECEDYARKLNREAKAPRVEDSHAKLAAEMRTRIALASDSFGRAYIEAWAARVEALGRVEEKKAAVIEAAIRYVECDDVHAKTFWLPLESAVRALVEYESASKKEDAGA